MIKKVTVCDTCGKVEDLKVALRGDSLRNKKPWSTVNTDYCFCSFSCFEKHIKDNDDLNPKQPNKKIICRCCYRILSGGISVNNNEKTEFVVCESCYKKYTELEKVE